MKNLFLFAICLMASYTLMAQNGTVEAEQGVILGNNSGTTDGTIRFTGTDFEGRMGGSWESLTSSSIWNLSGSDIFFNTGNVGIGTPTPMVPLHVVGGDTYLEGELYVGKSDFVNNFWAVAHFQHDSPGNGSAIYIQHADAGFANSDGAQFSLAAGTDPAIEIANREIGGIKFITGNLYTTRVTLTNDGDFGIGTDPLGRFHVAGGESYFMGNVGIGTTSPTDHLSIMDTNDPVLRIANDAFNEPTSGKLYFDEDITFAGLCGIGFEMDGATNRLHLVGGCPSLDTLMSVTRGGSFMFGTDQIASGYIMSVGGNIMCEELRVELEADWPDYVFTDEYELMSLTQLESFIQVNNHLPNIPSADEIKDSGLEVGDMQKRMMEKIEELTLYIIQQQKEIDALKGEIETLRK